MLSKKIIDICKADLYRYDKEDSVLLGFVRNPGFRYTFFLRLASHSSGLLYFSSKIILKVLTVLYGYEISEKTKIGQGLAIMHLGGIAINHKSEIGKNCTIYHGATLGGCVGRRKGAPKLGDKVWVGPNAIIVGNVKIGNNVLIAGNAFVNFDVPDDSLVIGNPGVIKKWGGIDDYIQWVKE